MATTQSIKGTFTERFWSRVQRADGNACWLWTAARFPAGYGKVALPKTRKSDGAHRIAWLLTNGPIPNGLWILHKCDNRACCRPDHLFLGDHAANMRDMHKKGRHPGWPDPIKRFTDDDVRAIRSRAAAGESHRSIARQLKANRRSVDRIIAGELYRTVA